MWDCLQDGTPVLCTAGLLFNQRWSNTQSGIRLTYELAPQGVHHTHYKPAIAPPSHPCSRLPTVATMATVRAPFAFMVLNWGLRLDCLPQWASAVCPRNREQLPVSGVQCPFLLNLMIRQDLPRPVLRAPPDLLQQRQIRYQVQRRQDNPFEAAPRKRRRTEDLTQSKYGEAKMREDQRHSPLRYSVKWEAALLVGAFTIKSISSTRGAPTVGGAPATTRHQESHPRDWAPLNHFLAVAFWLDGGFPPQARWHRAAGLHAARGPVLRLSLAAHAPEKHPGLDLRVNISDKTLKMGGTLAVKLDLNHAPLPRSRSFEGKSLCLLSNLQLELYQQGSLSLNIPLRLQQRLH